jgi:hypothetical protein
VERYFQSGQDSVVSVAKLRKILSNTRCNQPLYTIYYSKMGAEIKGRVINCTLALSCYCHIRISTLLPHSDIPVYLGVSILCDVGIPFPRLNYIWSNMDK